MDCITTARGPQWVLYHIAKQGGRGKVIESIAEALPSTPWDPPLIYVMTTMPPSTLPPWGGTLWVCSQGEAADGTLPDYCGGILRPVVGVLDNDDTLRWLMSTYREYPQALERLTLRLMVMARAKGGVLSLPDIATAVPPATATPFLWGYQPLIGSPRGLRLLHNASNSDLWGAFMSDGGLMKHIKGKYPHLVYSLLQVRGEVDGGAPLMDAAMKWHLTTMS